MSNNKASISLFFILVMPYSRYKFIRISDFFSFSDDFRFSKLVFWQFLSKRFFIKRTFKILKISRSNCFFFFRFCRFNWIILEYRKPFLSFNKLNMQYCFFSFLRFSEIMSGPRHFLAPEFYIVQKAVILFFAV